MGNVCLYSLDYKNSNLNERECFALSSSEKENIYNKFGDVVIVSTCNRVELYVSHKNPELVLEYFLNLKGLREFKNKFRMLCGVFVYIHLSYLLSGMLSAQLGENMIVKQVKDAYLQVERTVGKELHRLFQNSFRIMKIVRSQTDIGKGVVSVQSLIIKEIEKIEEQNILLVGSGDMIQKIFQATKNRYKNISICSSNSDAIHNMNNEMAFNKIYNKSELDTALLQNNIVISATSCVEPIITKAHNKSQCLYIDLGVPRNIATLNSGNVKQINMDNLIEKMQGSKETRNDEITKARSIVLSEVVKLK